MELTKLKSAFFLIILFLRAPVVIAQKKDFSGEWLLKEQKSISGRLYENGVPKKMIIQQKADKIIIEKTIADQNDKDNENKEIILFYGGPSKMQSKSNRKKTIDIQWSKDGKSFTTTTILYNTQNENRADFKVIDTWVVSGNDNLVMIRMAENLQNGEIWESKTEYERK